MANKKKEVTKAPSGLKITRSGNKFTASWKIGDKDYGDGQYLQYLINDTGKDSWQPTADSKKKIGVKVTSKAISIDKDNFYPNKDKKGNNKPLLYEIGFRVKGNRKKYTTGSGKKKKTHSPVSSEWTEKRFTVNPPKKPTLTVELDEELTNVCKFSWSAPYASDDSYIFTDTQWQTILVKNNSETDGSKLSWKGSTFDEGTAGAESSKTITEDTAILYRDGNSYTRWFRVRARGPKGVSQDGSYGWVYKKHVYALPNKTNVTSTSAKETDEGGFQCIVDWTVGQSNNQKPIDKVTVQYTIVVPDENLSCPNGASWTDANISRDTADGDAAVFSIDDQLGKDQCLFIRVNTQHDSNITYGKPKLSSVGFLKDPTGLSVQTNNVTHKATINATNVSDVEDSVLVVRYVPAEGDPIDVGIIPHGSSSVTVQCPNWDEQTAIGFEVYAMVGTATKQTREDGVDSYAVTPKMRSQNTVSQGGAVPVAPKNVNVSRVENKPDTVQVTWDWPWSEAGSAEISWSDHDDAWESTDEPESFLISNLHASKWNISGLETGKTWYVRVRLIAGNMSDSETVTYGPWSDISQGSIDLSSAPNKPVLILSDSIIPEDGSTIASWVYTTTDNTAQAYAEVAIVENGEYTPIAHSLTSQHVTIPAQSENYTLSTGNIYNLVCRVKSASGKLSEWSEIVSLTVAEPITCEITQTSLIHDHRETNPREFEGEGSVEFETEISEDFAKLQLSLEPKQDGTPWIGTTHDTTPYLHRAMPTQSNAYNRESGVIVGGTVAWNQLVYNGDFTTNGNWAQQKGSVAIANGELTYTISTVDSAYYGNQVTQFGFDIPANHVLFTHCETNAPYTNGFYMSARHNNVGRVGATGISNKPLTANAWNVFDGIGKPSNSVTDIAFYWSMNTSYSVGDSVKLRNVYITDLTALFGNPAIADYVYNLEQSTAGAGVAWLKEHFPKMFNSGYMAYDTGTLKSVEGLQSHDTVGFNLWDEEWEVGNINTSDGQNMSSTTRIRSKNYIRVIPNATYCFTIKTATLGASRIICYYDVDKNFVNGSWVSPTNNLVTVPNGACYMRFCCNDAYGTTYKNDICINISKITGTPKNGDYVPYAEHTYALDSDLVLRGIPKLDASNNLYYDGDTYASDGGVTRKYGVITLDGTSGKAFTGAWGSSSENPNGYAVYTTGIRTKTSKVLSDRFIYSSVGVDYMPLYSFVGSSGGASTWTFILPNTVTSLAEANAWLQANPTTIVYELATPTTEQAQGYTNPQIVDPDGTEQYVSTGIVPVGHESTYSLVCPIYGHDEVTVEMVGKNLLDRETEENGYINASGAIQTDGVSVHSAPMIVAEGEKYTFSGKVPTTSTSGNKRVHGYDESGNWIQQLAYQAVASGASYVITVTIPSGVKYAKVSHFSAETDCQFEKSATATDYEPYQGNTITTTLPQTVYGGTLDVVTGELVVDRAMALIKNLTWIRNMTSYPATPYFYTTISGGRGGESRQPLLLSSAYRTGASTYERADGIITNANYHLANILEINVFDSQHASVSLANFLEEMGDEQIVYPLATPQTYQLTPQQLETLKGLNKIESESGQVEIRIAESVWEANVLKEMPLAITVTGAGDGGITTIMVERAEDYPMERPDETNFHGNRGDIVLQTSPPLVGTNQVSFDVKNLIGPMDDGAAYNIVATVQDGLGQTDDAILPFEVHWTHQAEEPSAEIEIDEENLIAFITPIAPENADPEDVADIYRLSADRPELIVEGAIFGETYVDPYPALGDMGGHRIVTRTKNGDYITEDNQFAMVDSPELGVNPIENEDLLNIIDFEGRQIQFYWETNYSNTWAKDFQETQYLGGSIEGDWNPAVSRSGTLSSKAITVLDQEMLKDVRRLADYPGICHVRTADGSSYAADVQVSEDYTDDEKGMVTNYSLSITKVDPQGFEGMTKEQWEEENPPEEEEEP